MANRQNDNMAAQHNDRMTEQHKGSTTEWEMSNYFTAKFWVQKIIWYKKIQGQTYNKNG